MASLLYTDIFEYFLGEITDYNLAALPETDADAMMTEYLHKALANAYVFNLFADATLDDDIQTLTYDMNITWTDSFDADFVKNILGKAMAIEWVSPQINSLTNIQQFFGSTDRKFYAQSNHLAQLKELKSELNTEMRNLIENRGLLKNSYLEGL